MMLRLSKVTNRRNTKGSRFSREKYEKDESDLNEKKEVLEKDTKELTKVWWRTMLRAMAALKEKDMDKLSQLIHPKRC